MKKGFTMIELIFVIVILGILAAVAIPRMAATRDDAKISAIGTQVGSAIQEVSNYVTAHGGDANATSLIKESSVLKQMVDAKQAAENDTAPDRNVTVYGIDANTTCIHIDENQTSLIVTHSNETTNACKGITHLVKEANYTLSGSSIKY